MLDPKFIRENPDQVKENIKKKFQDERLPLVDEFIKLDKEKREFMQTAQKLRHERNDLNKNINMAKKKGEDASTFLQKAKDIPIQIKEIEDKQNILSKKIQEILFKIPNMIHESVPLGKNDKENVEVEKIGEPKKFDFEVKSHVEITEKLGIADFETSGETSGNGFYYISGDLALLNMALVNFARDYMVSQGYNYTEPPLMIRKKVLEGVYSNEEIEEMSYKIDGEDLYLIATSEHPLIGMFINKTLKKSDLPIKITGFSACFRKEIG
ncbi:serine--tRNA ligase, partial [Candidatus Woesearchaeota archaeon]|nr:serine--tRNA ligase [Candidatus Woesearchaeota archaeon]